MSVENNALIIKRYITRDAMGAAAAGAVADRIHELLSEKDTVNMIFAAAPSQNEFLAHLLGQPIPWERIVALHMDEYVDLPADAPQGFGNFLKERLFDKAPFQSVHYLNGNAADLIIECDRYAQLLTAHPPDIVCLGIGENGHIAFNDPPVADFNDPRLVKVVDLDAACLQQQVNDGCFAVLEAVPRRALTLTIPALMRGKYLYCMVPAASKARAVYNTLHAAIDPLYPSTILRSHANVVLFLDEESSALLDS
ncbi:6-phosphogluconolactonase [Niabella soli]|uniref:Glucosamine-6-phosphate deaminase n=1 Tax=Niabella soli DSM 19437 TaxID=929713 RepID=W0F2R2_9BACT|nr:6-phosphogluconolactonase [Niabella soli]AHF15774.1 glucosamine-6-phosphate deaminase [Niabella soli DSM 19437]